MKKQKPQNFYKPPENPIKMMPKPDPDQRPVKKRFKLEKRTNNFWTLFNEN
jgi:hypothetical protein